MDENKDCKAGYRLAARQLGGRLTIDRLLLDELRLQHLRTIGTIEASTGSPDGQALAKSVEWERQGNFMLHMGRRIEAVRAFRAAAESCLDGDYYDHGRAHYPSRLLRLRFLEIFDRAMMGCGDDPRLRELVFGDAFLMETYGSLNRFSRP